MEYYGMTDIGRKRAANQDNFTIKEYPGGVTLAVVCDGMGGANGGATASSVAVSAFVDHIDGYSDVLSGDAASADGGEKGDGEKRVSVPDLLSDAVSAANLAVYALGVSDPSLYGMGTTLVAALSTEDRICVVNVGDSRLYLIDRDGIRQITRDHSYVQHLVDLGRLSPRKARTARNKNIITRAVGTEETVKPDVFTIERVSPSEDGGNRYILLCSDGLTNMADPEDIAKIVMSPEKPTKESLRISAEKLVKLANDRGGADNITAVILAY